MKTRSLNSPLAGAGAVSAGCPWLPVRWLGLFVVIFLGSVGAWAQTFSTGSGVVGGHQIGYSALAGRTTNATETTLALNGWAYRQPLPPATVLGRLVFYNQSVWDGNSAAAGPADDAAIATDKRALLPGGKASITNYTSFNRGLNGLMVDVLGLVGNPTVSDFTFRTGNVATVASWTVGPAPSSVTVRRGAGTAGSDRVTLIWGADAPKKEWLQVKVRPTEVTGLDAEDTFYFGNAVGETGNSTTDARVTAADALRILSNVSVSVGVTNRFDINRDGRVASADRLLILANLSALNPLVLLDLSTGGALQARHPVTGAPPELTDVRRVETGMQVRWIADGSLTVIWTSDSVASEGWEVLDIVAPDGGPGITAETVLPVDPDGGPRFYRLEFLRGE